MKRNRYVGTTLLLSTAFLLSTCQKEYLELSRLSTEAEIEPRLVAPVVHGSATVSEALQLFDSIDLIGEFDDGLVYIAYSDTVVSVQARDQIEIPPIPTTEIYLASDADVPAILPVPPGDTFFLQRRVKILNFFFQGNDRIDSVQIKDGDFLLEIVNSFRHPGSLTISSPKIFDNRGDPFSRTFPVEDGTNGPVQTFTIPTDSFRIVPSARNDSNLFELDLDLALVNTGQPISPGESCLVLAAFENMDFYGAFGYIDGRDLLDQSGAIDIPIWEDNPDLASLEFADPRIDIATISSFGIPFEVDFDSVIATGVDGDQVELALFDGNTLEIPGPDLSRIGETADTLIEFDNTTSNIVEFLAVAPENISYRVTGRTASNTDSSHFVLNESQFDLAIDLLLPLDFKSTGYALTDTMEFSLGDDGVDTSLVKNAELTITTVNELPLELMLQVLFLDGNYVEVDSVFDASQPILGAATVDSEGKTTEGKEETYTVKLPASKLAKIGESEYLQLRARLMTSGGGDQFVKLLSTYRLDFEVSVLADFRINTEEL